MVLPYEDVLQISKGIPKHLVLITKRNLSMSDPQVFDKLKESMTKEMIQLNLINVLSPESQDIRDINVDMGMLIKVLGGENLPGVISLISEGSIGVLCKNFLLLTSNF